MSCVRLAVVLMLPLLLTLAGAARPASAEKSAAELLPPSTLAYVELSDPNALLSTTLDNPLRKQIEDSTTFRDAMEKPQARKLKQVVRMIEDRAGVQWRPALEQISGGGIVLAFEPLTQGVVVLVKPEDRQTADSVRDALISLARDEAKKHGKPDPVTTKTYRGLKAWHVNAAIVADLGSWVMICNKKGLAQRVADTFLDGGDALAGDDDFRAARHLAAGPGRPPSAWAFVRLAPIRLFAKQPWLDPKSKSDNPGIEFILGGLIPVAQNAPYATASLWAGHDGVKLAAAAPMDPAWVPADRKFFFASPPDGAASPLLPTGTLLSLTTYRDVAAMWQAGPDLFTESVATQMAQTDSGLSALLGGKSFGTDVLGAFKPQMQLVVARQDLPAGGLTPTLKLPAAALVLEIRPDQFAHVRQHFRVAFQTAIALGNLNGAQNGRALLELQTERRGDCEIQFATYSADDAPTEKKDVDKRDVKKKDMKSPKDDAYLNLSPTMAVSNKRLILSTSRQLAEQLADLDAKETSPARIPENTLIAGNPKLAADLIKANREQLVAGNMLQKGHDRKTAEQEISLLQAIADAFGEARVRLLPGQTSIRFEVELKTAHDATANAPPEH